MEARSFNMEESIFFEKYTAHLNAQQMEAVKSVDGPTLLLAVPGSGKTTVLVTRLGYMLLCKKIPPSQILTLTYTVAATRDMQARFESIFGTEFHSCLEFRTLNGICASIIYYFARKIGKKSFKLIHEDHRLMRLFIPIVQKIQGTYPQESDIKEIRTQITYIKNRMLSEEEIRKLESDSDYALFDIYKAYCEQMRLQGWMDFDDQMIYAYNILRKSPETLEHFQRAYTYVCVDEAQDTSKIQHAIIALLAGRYKNLFMVGDEDQSIYGFRAAYPEALLSFGKDYPGAKILLMEQNYRSNAHIVQMADVFIQKNELRYKKHMKATKSAGKRVNEISLKGRRMQYTYMLKMAQNCKEDTAVLYRDNESALPLVNLLEKNHIPYRMKSADFNFFSHRIIIDIQNIYAFAKAPKDTELFLQIYYKLNLYINKKDAAAFCTLAKEKDLTILEAVLRYGDLPAYQMNNIRSMIHHLETLLKESAMDALQRIIRSMGYGAYIQRAGIKDQKVYILQSLAMYEENMTTLMERLDELQELLRNKADIEEEALTLSTIHGSKGLEYSHVYILDVFDGVFPESVPKNGKNLEEQKLYEEERRLFYVAMTRAKEELSIFTFPRDSVFTSELFGQKKTEGKQATPQKIAFSEKDYHAFLNEFGEGVLVVHKKLGEGVIVDVAEDILTINFDGINKRLSAKILFTQQLLKIKNRERRG